MDFDIIDLHNLNEEAIIDKVALAKKIWVEGDSIIIHDGSNYQIEFSRCNTPEKILSWVLQLTEKPWMTTEILNRFVELACQKHSIERAWV